MNKILLLCSAAVLSSSALFAQIPNAGFETWTTASSYDVPTGWDNINSMTMAASTYTCMKGTPGNPGTSYIKLVSKTITGMGVVPGVAVAGTIDLTAIKPKSGFPNATRPASLTGSWQYMAYGSDQGHIAILLTKWNATMNKRDTVAFTDKLLPGMAMSWATFTIPITYVSGAMPDSAIIALSASGTTPVNNSYLYVDDLAFSGSVPAGVLALENGSSVAAVYPNPASGVATVSYTSTSNKDISILVTDLNGKNVLSVTDKAVVGANQISLNVGILSKGIYVINILDDVNITARQLTVE